MMSEEKVSGAGLWRAAVVLCLGCASCVWCALGSAGSAARAAEGGAQSRPAEAQEGGGAPARIEPAKDETPRQALERGCKVFDQLDVGRAMELFRYDEKEKPFVESMCAYAVSATRVEQAVRRKFGDAAAVEMVHAIGENAAADLAKADVTVEGDSATVKLPHSHEPIKMIKAGGVWLVSVKEMTAGLGDEEIKAAIESSRASAAAFDRVAAKVEAGKLKSPEEVNEVMQRILNPPAPQPGDPV